MEEERNETGIGLMANDRIPTVTTSEDVAAMELGPETPAPGMKETTYLSTASKGTKLHNACCKLGEFHAHITSFLAYDL